MRCGSKVIPLWLCLETNDLLQNLVIALAVYSLAHRGPNLCYLQCSLSIV